MTLHRLPFDQLLGRFADGEPTPGGGSASAIAGALAGALAAMVAGLTIGNKNYEAVADEAATLASQARALAERLSAAVDADAASFEAVMAAMGLPKETDEQKEARKAAMQAALKGATLTPLATARDCAEAAKLGSRLLAIGNRNASTDAGVAVLLGVAGAEGALFNVEINLGSIKDADWVAARRAEVDPLWAELENLRGGLWAGMREAGVETPRH